MARLNWENVANPNFSGVADSYRTMSDLLGKAVASGQGILDTYKGAQQENADRAILQRIAGIQDMSQFDPNAVIGTDGGKASLSTLGIVADRPDDLIKRAASLGQERRAQDTHGFNMKGNQRTMDSWLRTDAAAPVAQQIHQLRLQGKTAEADALLKDPRVAGLNISEYLNVAAMDGVAAGVESGRYNQGRSRKQDADSDATVLALDDVQANSFDAASAEAYALGRNDWSPEVRTAVLSRIGRGGGQPTGTTGTGSVSGTTGSPISSTGNPYDTVFGDRAGGNSWGFKPPKPISSMTVQEAIDYGKGTMIPATKGRIGKGDLGTSAVGAYQFISSTLPGLAEQTFGKDWKSVPMTPENQDLMAQKLFEQNKNGNLQKTWEGLPDTRPGAYANMSWPQIKAEIFKHEVGTVLTEDEQRLGGPNLGRDFSENIDTADRSSNLNVGSLISQYTQALGNRNLPVEAANLLASEIPGSDPARLETQINKIIRDSWDPEKKQYRINAAEAAATLKLASAPAATGMRDNFLWTGDIANWWNNADLGGGRVIDKRYADQLAATLLDDTVKSAMRTDMDDQAGQAVINQLSAKRDQLATRYQQAVEAAKVRPAIAAQLPQLKAAYDAAVREVAMARTARGTGQDVPTPELSPEELQQQLWRSAAPVSKSGRITGR